MRRKDVVAVGRWAAKGKEQLVLIRPYRAGLMLHQLFYSTEVRAFDDIDLGRDIAFQQVEQDLADKLIEQLSVDAFEPEQFEDSYTQRVREVIESKVAGQEISLAPEQPKAQIIDLFEALKQSIDQPAAAKSAAKSAAKKTTKKAGVKKARPRKRAKKTEAG